MVASEKITFYDSDACWGSCKISKMVFLTKAVKNIKP